MKHVGITFRNLQSHEATQFSLDSGLNFILAEDNNVGKSTIFKVLSTVAKAPNVSGAKIDRLIRSGADYGCAEFKYDGNRVVAWFRRGATPGSAKMFFEYVSADGESTRHLSCPDSLRNALGIVVGEDGDVLNFNDADSVQLFAKSSVESDNIIAHVMLDANVEHIKENMIKLSRELVSDDKLVGARVETAEGILSDLEYNMVVDDFNDNLPLLEVLCNLLDGGLTEIPSSVSYADLETLDTVVGILPHLEALSAEHDVVAVPGIVGSLLSFLDGFSKVDLESLQEAAAIDISETGLDRLQGIIRAVSVIGSVREALYSAGEAEEERKQLLREASEIQQALSAQTQIVDCPVKGRVYYTDEGCLPSVD